MKCDKNHEGKIALLDFSIDHRNFNMFVKNNALSMEPKLLMACKPYGLHKTSCNNNCGICGSDSLRTSLDYI